MRVRTSPLPALLSVLTLALGLVPSPASGAAVACPPDPASFNPFLDTVGNTHETAITCLVAHRVTDGVSPTAYAPATTVQRDQLAAFLARVLEAAGVALPPPVDHGFTDTAGSVHRDRIDQLAALGLLRGTTSTTYAPHDPVTRAQAATLLVRALEHAAGVTLPRGQDRFDDDDGSPHEPSIDAAAAAGLTAGVGDRRFAPAAPVRRDQLASLLVGVLDRLAASGQLQPVEPFRGTAGPLPDAVAAQMRVTSWRPGCPVGLDELALLEMTHRGFDGQVHQGQMVVAHDVAHDVLAAFRLIYAADFPIERMRLIDAYDGSDDASMADNNTSAFNCRTTTTGGDSFSQHAHGTAIDINPVQNPYVRGDTVEPPAGAAYLDRDDVRSGMVVRPGPVTAAFDALGWGWGGDWRTLKDYQHFSRSGR